MDVLAPSRFSNTAATKMLRLMASSGEGVLSLVQFLNHGHQRLPFRASDLALQGIKQELPKITDAATLNASLCITELHNFRHQAHRRQFFECLFDRSLSHWLLKWFGDQLYFHHVVWPQTSDASLAQNPAPILVTSSDQHQRLQQESTLLCLRLAQTDLAFELDGEQTLSAGEYCLIDPLLEVKTLNGRCLDMMFAVAPSGLDGHLPIEGLPTNKDLVYLSAPMLYRNAWRTWQSI